VDAANQLYGSSDTHYPIHWPNNRTRASMWRTDGQIEDLGSLGGVNGYSRVSAVNASGVPVGTTTLVSGQQAAWRGTVMAALPFLLNTHWCSATAINGPGAAVGTCIEGRGAPQRDVQYALLWPATGGVIDLNTRVSLQEWVLIEAHGISDEGSIIAVASPDGRYWDPPRRSFLLTPRVEPPSLVLLPNQTTFRPGETLHAEVERQGIADLHVAVILPDGVTTLFLTNMDTLSYIVSTIEQGPYPVTTGASLTHTWHALNEPGVYHIIAALSRPGSLADGRIDQGDIVALDWRAVQFAPLMASR
jgi:hypothetical protein